MFGTDTVFVNIFQFAVGYILRGHKTLALSVTVKQIETTADEDLPKNIRKSTLIAREKIL